MAGRTAVGITLDAGTLHAVELAADGEDVVIRRAVCDQLPPEAFADGTLTDANAVAEAVRHTLRTHHFPRRNLCIALGGKLAIARVIEAGAAGAEVQHVLQDRIGRYAMYEDLDILWKATPIETGEANRQAFLAAAVSKDEVATLLPALRRVGVRVSHVEPYALAAIRSLATCAAGQDQPTVLMILRNESTDFVIVKGARPLLVRSVDEGAYELARRPEGIEDLLVEARRSVDFCRSRFEGASPRLWVSLAGCEDPVVAKGLLGCVKQDAAGAVAEPLPQWPKVAAGANVDERGRQSWAAVGAAMVALGRDEITPHLNLVPDEWPVAETVQKQLMGLAASLAVAVVATVVASMMVRMGAGDTAKAARAASVQMQAHTIRVKTASELKRKAVKAAERVKLWKDVRASVQPSDWMAALETITAQVPEGVRVRKITYRRGVLRLAGETQVTDLVHQVVERLSRLPCLEEANVERLVRATGPGTPLPEYVISCRLREKQPAPPKKDQKDAPRPAG